MPEIKHQFTGGKMNKDLDERLVPNGQYRHAMNIQVSESDGSNAGTIQNILGNQAVFNNLPKTNNTCVGSISDEKTNSVYFFLAARRFDYFLDIASVVTPVFSRDYIVRLKDNQIISVFTDLKQITAKTDPDSVTPFDYAKRMIFLETGSAQHISEGDVLEVISSPGLYSARKLVSYKVTFVQANAISGDPDFVILDEGDGNFNASALYGQDPCEFIFRTGCLKFDSETLITGINIIDDMLFWTDGVNEPKKINISRSIEGTSIYGLNRTKLINEEKNITISHNINVKEEHITVIKKGPSKPPSLEVSDTLREDGATGTAIQVDFGDGSPSPSLKNEGDMVSLLIEQNGTTPFPVMVGDTLLLEDTTTGDYPPEVFQLKLVVVDVAQGGVSGTEQVVEARLTFISEETPLGLLDFRVAIEEQGLDLFARKFPRFAYRYKYKDGEYSTVGPFSDVGFLPGSFQYEPREAFNKGMINNLKTLKLKDFVPPNIPNDVIAVDLLYKDEASPNIYSIKSITPLEDAWIEKGSYNASFGSYEITTDNIYAVLPSNQTLRLWDNVPKTALAQEVIASRVVYANYTQGYDMETLPSIISSIVPRDLQDTSVGGKKSIKSLRTYNIGVVYGDEYGRETPVFANKDSNIIGTKSMSSSSNLLKAEIGDNHPSWAKYYKFFVKETSSEYYNLALDRVYNAEDDGVWLSFPSTDRNKVDEDTYLILKKGMQASEGVSEEGRYKIISIENEAPEYIKTYFTTIARPTAWANVNTGSVFGGSGGFDAKAPFVGSSSFYIDKGRWISDASTTNKFGMPGLHSQWAEKGSDELYVSFVGNTLLAGFEKGNAIKSKKYRITNVNNIAGGGASYSGAGNPGVPSTKAMYEVFTTPIKEVDSWITQTPGATLGLNGSGFFHSLSQTQHRPIIHKKQVINKPEFDGRFFVKIKNDDIIKSYLPIENEDENQDFRVVSSSRVYLLRDGNALNKSQTGPDYNLQVNTTSGADTTDVVHGSDVSKTRDDWNKLMKFGTNKEQGRWFIDQMAFAGMQPSTSNSFLDSMPYGSDTSTSQTFYKPNNAFLLKNFPSYDQATAYNSGTGLSDGSVFHKGIYTEINPDLISLSNTNGYEHKFVLSYSVLNPNTHNNHKKVNDGGWGVGDPGGSYNIEQLQFAQQIKEGSKFRFDTNLNIIYKITGVSKQRTYNYRGNIPYPYKHGNYYRHLNVAGLDRDACYREFGFKDNRRLSYTITYSMETSLYNHHDAMDGANQAIYGAVDATNATSMQFIEPFDSDRPNEMARYPAVFETEPKEEVDLDIYYEASSSIPTSIKNGDGEMLVPIGSKMRIDNQTLLDAELANHPFDDGITAFGWGGSFAGGYFQHNVINIVPNISADQANLILPPSSTSPVIISFDNLIGGIAYVELTNFTVDPITLLINGFIVEPTGKVGLSWFNCWSFGNGVESNRIGDTYNKTYLTNGPKVSTTLDAKYEEEKRKHSLIYSGLYNSTSGVNNLNQFIAAEKITKDLNPAYGSIQKLHARSVANGDLIALCEDRVLKILANKDAIFNADGNSQLIATENVLGHATPFSGEYGISTNPESFASDSYRAYFTDKVRGTVMRLSMDGLTPISDHGMKDWFRVNLKSASKIVGSFDDRNKEYNITLPSRKTETFYYRSELVQTAKILALTPADLDPATPPISPPLSS